MDITIDLPSGVDYEKLSAAVANSKMSASQVILARLIERQQSKIATMTPAERADFERRQADREKRLMEEAHEHLSSHPWESIDEFLNAVAGDFFTFFTGADDDLADMTLDKLQERQAELEAARKRIDALLDANLKAQDVRRRLDRIETQGAELKKDVAAVGQGVKDAAREGAKKAVETTLPKEYAKTANMSDEELREATKPKTRSHGGGRKKERDLDDAQVKAVLADMKKHTRESLRAYCDYIIKNMKDGMYQNPFETAKDLDSAVRRYCKKNGIPLVVKTRTGRWSAKK